MPEVPMLLLLASAQAATPSELLASVKTHLDHGEGCLTPLVNELRQRADELTPAERREAAALLTPWQHELRPPGAVQRAAPPPPPAGEPTEPCFTMGENRRTSAHFAVEWDGDTISESTAEYFLEALEDGYRVEVEELGWEPPLQGDDYLLLAYVQDGNYQGAYTTVDYCGSGIVPYIVAYSGSFSSRSWAETMAVHEFNHAVQFGYGFSWEFWWWEATATYIESQVYPSSNWWAYYVTGYTDNPGIAFNASDQNDQDIFWHMYGMAIWAAYIDEYLGGHETVLATWQAADNERGTYTFGMPDAFEEIGLDFDAAYTDFIAKNTVMLYEAQSVLPSVDETRSIDELPASADPDRDERPEGYGQVYTRIEAGAGEGELVLDFEGEDDIAWSVQLVEVDRDEILRVEVAEIVDGVGTVSLADFGEEDVVVVVSPLEYDGARHSYEWSAYIAEPPAGDDSGGDTDGQVDDDGEEKPGGGCGCDSTPAPAAGLLSLLGLAALSRRRR